MWDIVMGQGLGQLLPPPPSTTTTTSSPTIVVRTPPQSDGVCIQSHNSGSVNASPDKAPPIPPSIAADAAESNTLQHPAVLSIAADAAESLNFGTNTLQHPAAIAQCMDSGCTVKPTAKPDKVQPIPSSIAADAAEPDKVQPIPSSIAADAAEPDKVQLIPSSIAADAAESLNFGANTLQHPAAITLCMVSGCTVKPTAKPDKVQPIPPSIAAESLNFGTNTWPHPAADAAESLKFGTNTLQSAATTQCMDPGRTAKPDKVLHSTVESLISKLKALTLVQKPDGASIRFGDLGCGCSKSNKVLGTPPSIFDAIEDAAGDFSGLDDASPKSDKVRPSPPSTANFVESLSAGWDDNAKFNTPPSTVNAVEYGSTILEVKPTGWEDEEISKKAVPMTNKDGDGEGVKYPTGWEDEEISKKAVSMTNKDGDGEGVKYPTGWEDEEISKKAVPMTNKGGNGEDGVKYRTWWGVEVKPTGWEDEEISKKAVLMTNKGGNGEEVKYPTWCGVEVKPTGWEDEEISKKAVLMTDKDGNGEEVKCPTWCGVEVKPTGWGDEEVSKKPVPMTNMDGNGEGVKYPTWTTGWEDGERSNKAFLKPNKDGSCEGVKYPERSAVKYPERPGQPDCSFYVHTGICKFGLSCKFNHPATHPATRRTRAKAKPKKPPEPIQTGISKLPMTSNTEEPVLGSSAPFHCPPAVTAAAEACPQSKILEELEGKSHGDRYHSQRPEGKLTPEESISSKEGKSETDFPQRPGKPDCSFYLNTGNCQFGSNCRFNHPSRRKGNKKDAKEHIKNSPLGKTGNPESKADKGKQSKTFPGRTVQAERKINTRQYSVPGGNKSGTSSRHAQFPGKTEPGPVELNFLGLPIRPGERECANYMHTGVCKFATNCRFHHPNPTPVTAEDTLSASQQHAASPQQHAASPQQHASGASPLPTTSWTLPNASCGPLPYPSPPYTPGFYPLPSQGIYPHPGWSEYQVPMIPSFPPEMVSGNSSQARQERPGQATCHSFARTGYCKFKSACKYCHPKSSPESTDGSESTL